MRRFPSLDILRGFALCGILFANAPAILHLSWTRNGSVDPMVRWLEFTVHDRFFPLFSVLFGVSFALMWRSAGLRARSPRLVMVRRILVIGVLGALHQLLQPGEALLPYALVALALLLPATFLPNRWAGPVTGIVGALLTAWAATGTSGLPAVPGLFLLGFAAGTIGMPQWLERIDSQMLLLGLVLLVPAVVGALVLQSAHPGFGVAAGLVMALTYAGVVLMLLGNRSHGPAAKVLAALGRTALTNYLLATVIVVAVRFFAPQLGLAPEDRSAWVLTLLLCVLILTAQAALSLWWLDHFDRGPVEWLVRRLTWAGAAPAAAASPVAATPPAAATPSAVAASSAAVPPPAVAASSAAVPPPAAAPPLADLAVPDGATAAASADGWAGVAARGYTPAGSEARRASANLAAAPDRSTPAVPCVSRTGRTGRGMDAGAR